MDQGAFKNLPEGETVPFLVFGIRPAFDDISHLDVGRCDDIPLFAIRIMQQSDSCGAVGIIFDMSHFGRNAILGPFEIDNAISLLVAASTMPAGDTAIVVAS